MAPRKDPDWPFITLLGTTTIIVLLAMLLLTLQKLGKL